MIAKMLKVFIVGKGAHNKNMLPDAASVICIYSPVDGWFPVDGKADLIAIN